MNSKREVFGIDTSNLTNNTEYLPESVSFNFVSPGRPSAFSLPTESGGTPTISGSVV